MDEIKQVVDCPNKDEKLRKILEKLVEFTSKILVADMNQKNQYLQNYLQSGCGISNQLLDQFCKSFVESFLVTESRNSQNLLLKQALNIFQFVVVENSSKIGKVLAQVPMVSISILHHILIAYAHAV